MVGNWPMADCYFELWYWVFYKYFFLLANAVNFEQLFHSYCNITNGMYEGVGKGWQLEAGYTFHKDISSSAVSSICK